MLDYSVRARKLNALWQGSVEHDHGDVHVYQGGASAKDCNQHGREHNRAREPSGTLTLFLPGLRRG